MTAVKSIVENPPWTPFEDRRRLRDEKREAVLRMAVRLFLEEGYHRTPLARIAERLNITKPALYNYFSSKDEILSELSVSATSNTRSSFGQIAGEGGNGLEKLKALIRAYAWSMTTDFGMCFARLDDRELGEQGPRRGQALEAALRPGLPPGDRAWHRGRLDPALRRQACSLRGGRGAERDRRLV